MDTAFKRWMKGEIRVSVYLVRWLRENIGYINQEPTLFATSIFENIKLITCEAQ
jgi:ABC-type multidrug transport system fused ATPase/permease subunit